MYITLRWNGSKFIWSPQRLHIYPTTVVSSLASSFAQSLHGGPIPWPQSWHSLRDIVLLDIIALLEDSEDNSDEEFQQEIQTTNEEKDQTPISEIKSNLEDTEDDIPEELKEVFREDDEKDNSREVQK